MSDNKTISASTLVELKAELYRKQQEVKEAKTQFGPPLPNKSSKRPAWLQKNRGVEARSAKDIQLNSEPDNDSNVRKCLEAKAALYDRMKEKVVGDDPKEDRRFLVDFQRKPQQEIEENFEETNEDDWVDYVDSFGRSRRCLKTDLIYMQKRDVNVSTQQQQEDSTYSGPVHYQRVAENEIRNYGAGYYAFSQDAEERKKQQDALKELREQTTVKRQARQAQLLKRKKLMKERLKKVKERRALRAGLPLPEHEDNSSDSEDDDRPPSPPSSMLAPARVPVDAPLPPVRPWDVGKPGVRPMPNETKEHYVMTQEEWVGKQREKRESDFAPPSFYAETQNKSKDNNEEKGGGPSVVLQGRLPNDRAGLGFEGVNIKNRFQKKKKPRKQQNPYFHNEVRDQDAQPAQYFQNEVEEQQDVVTEDIAAEESTSSRGVGAEIAPPSTFEYYGPSSTKTKWPRNSSENDMMAAIDAGILNIRKKVERERGDL